MFASLPLYPTPFSQLQYFFDVSVNAGVITLGSMNRPRLTLLFLAVVLLALGGCSVIDNPLFKPGDMVEFDGLEGTWAVKAEGSSVSGVVVIEKFKESNKYKIVPIDAGSLSNESIEAVVIKIADAHYFDVFLPNSPQYGHIIFRIARNGNEGHDLTIFNVESVRQSEHLAHRIEKLHLDLKSGGISIPISKSIADAGVRITASTSELQDFFETHPDLYWGSQIKLVADK